MYGGGTVELAPLQQQVKEGLARCVTLAQVWIEGSVRAHHVWHPVPLCVIASGQGGEQVERMNVHEVELTSPASQRPCHLRRKSEPRRPPDLEVAALHTINGHRALGG